jgi:hypothetical protein
VTVDQDATIGNDSAECECEPAIQPAGAGEYVARQGECISSIAAGHGLFWKTLWDHPQNAELRSARVDPNVLLPGDRLYLPPLREKHEPGATEQRHRFRRKGEPARLRLRLLANSLALANQPYILDVDGRTHEGTLDADGKLDVGIPAAAREGTLRVGTGERQKVFPLKLGRLNPVDDLRGVQARLNGLGFVCGPVDGLLGPLTRNALRLFQRDAGIEVTGRPDDATRRRLKQEYGS